MLYTICCTVDFLNWIWEAVIAHAGNQLPSIAAVTKRFGYTDQDRIYVDLQEAKAWQCLPWLSYPRSSPDQAYDGEKGGECLFTPSGRLAITPSPYTCISNLEAEPNCLLGVTAGLGSLGICLLDLLVVGLQVDAGQDQQDNQDAGCAQRREEGVPAKLLNQQCQRHSSACSTCIPICSLRSQQQPRRVLHQIQFPMPQIGTGTQALPGCITH